MPRRLRNLIISTGLVGTLLFAAAALYSFVSYRAVPERQVMLSTAAPAGLPQPAVLAPNSPESVYVEGLTSPVSPGATVSLTVKTNPGSHCSLQLAGALMPINPTAVAPAFADQYGVVSWLWPTLHTAAKGNWPVTASCDIRDRSAVVVGTVTIQ